MEQVRKDVLIIHIVGSWVSAYKFILHHFHCIRLDGEVEVLYGWSIFNEICSGCLRLALLKDVGCWLYMVVRGCLRCERL